MTSPRNSVLHSQARVHSAEQELSRLHEKLRQCLDRLEKARESHREQIAKPLQSRDPEEKQMAESIATWWEVSRAD